VAGWPWTERANGPARPLSDAAFPDAADLLTRVRRIHATIRDQVVSACERQSIEALSAADDEGDGDTIFAIDRISEQALVPLLAAELAAQWPLVLIAEGLPDTGYGVGVATLPAGTDPDAAVMRVIVDPIDGTRGLMYQKRSGWILTGIAPNRGAATSLRDVTVAVQTEIPVLKQSDSDVLWAVRGEGAQSQRYDRRTATSVPVRLRPSRATSLLHGFAQISRFVPGNREVLAAIDDEVMHELLGPVQAGKAAVFEDQYISTGGQLYELVAGHDRFTADLRPLMRGPSEASGSATGLCAHPYDLAAVLIAEEAGVVVTDARGRPLDVPLDVATECAWAGYANESLHTSVEPVLQGALRRRGLI
jgi:fructose-1,6-bisphosphatase/inositol monophosphatase family enzyme